MMNDTIVAISTTMGVGAISIVRLSGKQAISIVNQSFKGKNLEEVPTHTINYGHIYDGEELIDEVLVSVMRGPKSFTAEDIVEINCHGGIITTNRIFETMLNNGARLAEPGEFTKRAFLNGRIDLVKSEAVMDLIESKSDEARKIALSQLGGRTSNLITKFRDTLKYLLSSIEVNIDYPEYYDIEVMTIEKVREKVSEMKKELEKLVNESENTITIKNGIKTVIIGKPNVGKSSILNKLLEKEKAIVTDIAGTTRDIVEGEIYLDGILLNIIDTAGIRSTEDVVEKIGVEKSLSMIAEADLVIVVLNSNECLSEEDKEILEKTKDKTRIVVLNKNDLTRNLELPENIDNVVETNTNDYSGINSLKSKIKELFNLEQIATKDYTYLTNSRQISLAKQAYRSLLSAETAIQNDEPVDIIEIDLKECFDILGEIIGATYSEEIIDNLFENFCVGK
ncbi:MAG: tRNA uridine-5-carboxymethylaminomethyl(34) synthesis GTPase MnmE [Bacilli bacterium]|nr:tRNA uridine-5-carboxymethylaminomethyl(34) synthesis GTPase MnmE [Bacilli bacterium]